MFDGRKILMNDKTGKQKDNPDSALRINESKWSKGLMAAGWTVIPNVIIERQLVLGLDAIDINILMHLALHWWTADNKPHPSKSTIAKALKVHPRTVQRHIAAMERSGLIRREQRRVKGKGSNTNLYHFDGLIKEAIPYAIEKVQEIASREAERKARAARKGRPRLRLVKDDE
jgi:predicted transcriptional regulator